MDVTNSTNELEKCLRNCKKMVLGLHGEIDEALRSATTDVGDFCLNGADLNYLQQERGFALIPNVFWSKMLILFFVDKGMDVNSRDENGDTALHLAIRHFRHYPHDNYPGHPMRANSSSWFHDYADALKYLASTSDLSVTNLRGETALFTMAKCNHFNYDVLKTLTRGADQMETLNFDGESVLHQVQTGNFYQLIKDFEGNVDFKTSPWLYSQTPLMVAAKNGSLRCCELLIEKGAFVNERDLQGYTALHHAVLNGAKDCAEFLVRNGADTNAKSVSSIRDVYDLGVYRRYSNPFTFGVEHARLAEIHEIAGAMSMMRDLQRYPGVEQWEKVIEIYSKMDQELNRTAFPSLTFMDNYNFLVQKTDANQDDIHLTSMYTVSRLSKGISKFWNLLPFSYKNNVNNTNNYHSYVFKNLESLSDDLEWVGYFASFEEADFKSLLQLVKFFDEWLKKLIESESKNELAILDRISHLHAVVELVLACFTRRINETKSLKVSGSCLKLYVELCHVLTSIHVLFHDVISKDAFKNNDRLLRTLVNLDLRDGDDNSLSHLLLKNETLNQFGPQLLLFLLDFLNVTSRNRMGFEPIQTMVWKEEELLTDELLQVFVKMADSGAHVDARNVNWGGSTLRGMFEKQTNKPELFVRYDNLKCACARVVARSLVPYRNRVPQKIVDFIQAHSL